MTKVLIAGCGYLGQEIAAQFREQGAEILGLTHSEESAEKLRAEVDFQVGSCDLGKSSQVEPLGSFFDPSVIVHCASSGRRGSAQYEAVYLGGCQNLLAAFPRATLIFTSSTSVYPQIEGEVVDESSSAEPARETGQVLRGAENLVLENGGVVARLAGLYGPGRSVILQRVLGGTAMIETGESRFLNQIHRDDAASAVVALATALPKSAGAIFNVCDGSPTTLRATYTALAEFFRLSPPPEGPRDLNRKRGWTHKQIQNAKLRALGWTPAFPSFLDAVRADPRLVPSIQQLLD
ncbi:MAG: nucleoside-diphosphate-sugar epimerase [Verrucomicrobiales bacterium]|jgi:nucleoside-diphosphate-sugar epimerase